MSLVFRIRSKFIIWRCTVDAWNILIRGSTLSRYLCHISGIMEGGGYKESRSDNTSRPKRERRRSSAETPTWDAGPGQTGKYLISCGRGES